MSSMPGWSVIVQETDVTHKQVRDRLNILKDCIEVPEHMPLVFARLAGTTHGLAFVYWPAEDLQSLTPPYKVVECLKIGQQNDYRLVIQPVQEFVHGLADYRTLIHLEDA
jgi:hypothetical protein